MELLKLKNGSTARDLARAQVGCVFILFLNKTIFHIPGQCRGRRDDEAPQLREGRRRQD